MEASVAEIHYYPLRPDGFEEPLFPTRESKRAVAEHLLGASWLSRMSEVEGSFSAGQAAHVRRERVKAENRCGRVCDVDFWEAEMPQEAVGGGGLGPLAGGSRLVGRRATDRTVVRVLLSDGAVVDLAREASGWFLVGVAD